MDRDDSASAVCHAHMMVVLLCDKHGSGGELDPRRFHFVPLIMRSPYSVLS